MKKLCSSTGSGNVGICEGLMLCSSRWIEFVALFMILFVFLGLFDWCTRRSAQDAVSMSLVKQRMSADVCRESVRQSQEISYGKYMNEKIVYKTFSSTEHFWPKNFWIPEIQVLFLWEFCALPLDWLVTSAEMLLLCVKCCVIGDHNTCRSWLYNKRWALFSTDLHDLSETQVYSSWTKKVYMCAFVVIHCILQDRRSTWRCLQKIGQAHPELTLPLVPELLAIHPFFDTPEPDVEDPACILWYWSFEVVLPTS